MTQPSRFRRALVLGSMVALGAVGSACSMNPGSSASGERGKVSFEYGGWECLFGCGIERPLLVGSHETVQASGDSADEDGVTATSTKPYVAAVVAVRSCFCERQDASSVTSVNLEASGTCTTGFTKRCDNDVTVDALAAGDTDLVLHRKDGSEIDRVGLHVARAASVRLVDLDGRAPLASPVPLSAGGSFSVVAELRDASGERLLASDGVTWSATGAMEMDGLCFECNSDLRSLSASASGAGTVTVTAPDVTATATFVVHP